MGEVNCSDSRLPVGWPPRAWSGGRRRSEDGAGGSLIRENQRQKVCPQPELADSMTYAKLECGTGARRTGIAPVADSAGEASVKSARALMAPRKVRRDRIEPSWHSALGGTMSGSRLLIVELGPLPLVRNWTERAANARWQSHVGSPTPIISDQLFLMPTGQCRCRKSPLLLGLYR